jgi:hypothetical protein
MDRAESTVRKMLTAIEAPLFDIGVLNDRGMLPGLDSIPAAAVLDRLSLLKHSNARGSHIYIRPSGAAPDAYARARSGERRGRTQLGCRPGQHGDFFDCTLAGMRMAEKAGKSRKALRNIAILAEERIADYRLLDLCRSHTNGLARYGIAPEYAEGGRSYRLERTAIFPLPINEAVLGLPLFASKEFWAARTSLECLLVHWYSAVIGASSVSPSFVNEYSTPTGDSVRTRRATSPLRSSCRKHCVSIFCEMPGTPRFNTLKRALPS